MRLFAFAYAGGGISAFFKWSKAFPPHLALCPVLLPGRETAIGQPPIADPDRLLTALAEALAPALDRPYAIFGYSLGAKLGYALTHRLLQRGLPPPLLLSVAANPAPTSPPHRPRAHLLPDAEFIAYLRELGGTPAEVLASPPLLELLLPALRADFALVDRPMPLGPVPCPIVACAGTEDAVAPPAALFAWRRFTEARFVLRAFPGRHFFLREQMRPLIASLIGDLEHALAAA